MATNSFGLTRSGKSSGSGGAPGRAGSSVNIEGGEVEREESVNKERRRRKSLRAAAAVARRERER
jgi:hypothetical protein